MCHKKGKEKKLNKNELLSVEIYLHTPTRLMSDREQHKTTMKPNTT